MNPTTTYVVSAVLALGFHAAVMLLLLMNWDDNELVDLPDQRYYIEASIVAENPFKARKRREEAEKSAADKKSLARRKTAEEKERLKREAIEKAAEMDLQLALRKEKEELEAVSRSVEELAEATSREVAMAEAQRVEMEQGLALSVLEEQEYRLAVTDDEKAMAYVSQIKREIVHNWSRPPTARNGMEASLRVFLVPTGEVVNVVLEQSSGNDAFDRSALLAVRKAQRFQVPGDSRQFERNFREFTVLFRPEDLRL